MAKEVGDNMKDIPWNSPIGIASVIAIVILGAVLAAAALSNSGSQQDTNITPYLAQQQPNYAIEITQLTGIISDEWFSSDPVEISIEIRNNGEEIDGKYIGVEINIYKSNTIIKTVSTIWGEGLLHENESFWKEITVDSGEEASDNPPSFFVEVTIYTTQKDNTKLVLDVEEIRCEAA